MSKTISIKLYDFGLTYGDVRGLKDEIEKRLVNSIFDYGSMLEFQYAALKLIYPINIHVRPSPESVYQAIKKVMEYFDTPSPEKFKILVEGEALPGTDPVSMFNQYILGFDKLPSDELAKLKQRTEQHLKSCNELIHHYEDQEIVRKFLDKREIQRDHESRVMLDFYVRCLGERQKILDYLLTKVHDRAIEKSKCRWWVADWFYGIPDILDHPYETARGLMGKVMDYRRIDCVSHRISEVEVRYYTSYRDWYYSNKVKFYKSLFKLRSIRTRLRKIKERIRFLPVRSQRAHLFAELEKLMLKKNWLAYYSVGLPQVEGLFAEMIQALNPASQVLTKALSDKVKSIRPHYEHSDFYFDYFEYELPRQRNRFAHIGVAEDYELLAYDTLTDLEFLVTAFASLKSPLVRVTRIIQTKRAGDFQKKDFLEYFSSIDELKSRHKANAELWKAIRKFNDALLEGAPVLELLRISLQELLYFNKEVSVAIATSMKDFELPELFYKINSAQVEKLLKRSGFKDALAKLRLTYRTELNTFIEYYDLISGVKRHLHNERIPAGADTVYEKHLMTQPTRKFLQLLSEMIPDVSD